MTLDEWQRNELLVGWASKLMATNEWRLLLEMLATEHPMNKVVNKPGFSVNDDTKALGIILGWNMCRDALKLAALWQEMPQGIEETFEPIETEETPKTRKKKR